jgi:uncharacterized protein YndB with AHSA1/START domain
MFHRTLFAAAICAIATASVGQALATAKGPAVSVEALTIRRTVRGTPDNVFRMWIDATSIGKWFIDGASVHWAEPPHVDARVGGTFHWKLTSDAGTNDAYDFHGTYRQLHSPLALTCSWEWTSLPIAGVEQVGRTVVRITLLSQGDSTVITLTQTGFTTAAARAAHEKGWNRCISGIEHLIG